MSVSLKHCYRGFFRNIGTEIFASGAGSWIVVKGLEKVGVQVPFKTALTVCWGHRLVQVVCASFLDRVGFGKFTPISALTCVALETVCLKGRVTLSERHFGLSPLVSLALYGMQRFGTVSVYGLASSIVGD